MIQLRYGNALSPTDPPATRPVRRLLDGNAGSPTNQPPPGPDAATSDPLLIRYAHALLDAFPGEHDEQPARGLRHWPLFEPYVDELRREIAAWYEGSIQHHTLTALLWHVGQRIYNRGEGLKLLGVNPGNNRLHLQFGLLELGKILCREVEERKGQQA